MKCSNMKTRLFFVSSALCANPPRALAIFCTLLFEINNKTIFLFTTVFCSFVIALCISDFAVMYVCLSCVDIQGLAAHSQSFIRPSTQANQQSNLTSIHPYVFFSMYSTNHQSIHIFPHSFISLSSSRGISLDSTYRIIHIP